MSAYSLARAVPAAPASEPPLDVYLLTRTFGSNGGKLFHSLPSSVQQFITDCGFCHYLVVFGDPSSQTLLQCDFGPASGGDVALPSASGRRGVPGSIREQVLTSLPDSHLHVGTAALRLQDVRDFNAKQNMLQQHYLLNQNDCRHYINSIVSFATGHSKPTVMRAVLRHKLVHKRAQQGHTRLRWQDRFIICAQTLTDVSHWPSVRLAGQTTGTLLGTLLGRGLLLARTGRVGPAAQAVAVAAPAAAIARPRLPALAMRRASTALAATAQAPTARAGRLMPIVRQAAALGARARTSLHAAASTAAGSLRRATPGPILGGGAASSLAAAAAGALRKTAGRGYFSPRGGRVPA